MTLQTMLRNHAFAEGLPDEHIALLATFATHVTFDEDETIMVDGRRATAFYLLLSGSVSVELRTPRFSVCLQSLEPGQAFGWSALLDDQDTLFQVRAREKTTALRIEGAKLSDACRTHPDMGAEILRRTLRIAAARIKATEERFAEMCGIRV